MDKIPEHLKPEYYFGQESLNKYPEIFKGIERVWEAIPRIKQYVAEKTKGMSEQVIDKTADISKFAVIEGPVIIGAKTKINPFVHLEGRGPVIIGDNCLIQASAVIEGPCIIGNNVELRPSTYLRANSIIGDNCIYRGEMKNSLMLPESVGAHWPYAGDSIIGSKVNLGARTTLANLKVKPSNVKINIAGEVIDTKLEKLGAIIGDKVSTGCHSETNPGTIIGPEVMIYPGATIGPGHFEGHHIIKYKPKIDSVKKEER